MTTFTVDVRLPRDPAQGSEVSLEWPAGCRIPVAGELLYLPGEHRPVVVTQVTWQINVEHEGDMVAALDTGYADGRRH